MADKELPKQITLPHKQAPDFVSTYAQNVLVHGPLSGDKYVLVFHREMVELSHEVAVLQQSTEQASTYQVVQPQDGIHPFREDAARIIVDGAVLAEIARVLSRVSQQREQASQRPSGGVVADDQ